MSSGTSTNSVPVRPMIPGKKSPEKKRREGPFYIDPEAGSPVNHEGFPVEYHYPHFSAFFEIIYKIYKFLHCFKFKISAEFIKQRF